MIKILNPPVKLTVEIILFLFECNKRGHECTEKEIINFLDKTESYISKAIEFLKENNIVEFSDGKYMLKKEVAAILNNNKMSAKNLIIERISDKKEFIEYIYFLSLGKSPLESAKLVKTIYNLDHDVETIIKIFSEWIKFLDLKVKQKLPENEQIGKLDESINSKILANKYLKGEFGDFYSKISEQVIKDLILAITRIKVDTGESINDSGRALEDFLRLDIANDKDLTKCAGIIQITNELNKYPEFPVKLNNIANSLGNVRSMGKAHGVDAKIKERWNITEISAISYTLLIISLMKSYLEYKHNHILIF